MSVVERQTPLASTGLAHDVVIRPPGRWGDLRLSELIAYRELLYFLTKRELQIRYKQSLFGIAWAVLQPLALMAIFSIFFGHLAGIPSEGIPYPVFAFAALVPWTFVAQGTSTAALSLVSDANILSKVYFPRLLVPTARVLSLLVDFVLALVVLFILMALYGVSADWAAIAIVPLALLALITALGVGTFLATLNVRYRDVALAVPLALQLWLFATPVVYPADLVTGAWQYVYALNPMVTVISGARWALIGTDPPSLGSAAISVAAAAVILSTALLYFRRAERFFADII
jgi:lipopolysaccharide transport system permease protein